jgi:adenylosuccinate synthase
MSDIDDGLQVIYICYAADGYNIEYFERVCNSVTQQKPVYKENSKDQWFAFGRNSTN